VYPKVLGLSR